MLGNGINRVLGAGRARRGSATRGGPGWPATPIGATTGTACSTGIDRIASCFRLVQPAEVDFTA